MNIHIKCIVKLRVHLSIIHILNDNIERLQKWLWINFKISTYTYLFTKSLSMIAYDDQIENPNIYGILAFNFYCDVTINKDRQLLNVTSQLLHTAIMLTRNVSKPITW